MPDRNDKLASLAVLVTHARKLPQQARFESVGHRLCEDPNPVDQVEHFAQALLSGALPDAETLMFVAESFFRYIDNGGVDPETGKPFSLDDAFTMPPRRRVGNPAQIRRRDRELGSLLFDMVCLKTDNPSMSLLDAAENVLPSNHASYTPETLVRYYNENGFHLLKIPSLPSESDGE